MSPWADKKTKSLYDGYKYNKKRINEQINIMKHADAKCLSTCRVPTSAQINM